MSANQSRGYLAPGGERGPHDPRPRYVNDLLTVCDWCGHRLERVPGRPKVWWHA